MKRTEILEKLKDILISADSKNMELAENCTESANLYTDFGLTSVNMLFMVIAIEEDFNIRFDDVSMDSFATLGDVVSYIEGKLQ